MKICVIGTGYVGLVTGICLAEMGNQVWCVDKDAGKIAYLRTGKAPIYEPGIEDLLIRNLRDQRLHFAESLSPVLAQMEFCFIAVGTPPGEDGSADLQSVRAVAVEIGQYMDSDLVIVNKSTVPVGTGEMVKSLIGEQLDRRTRSDLRFSVVSNPEFLKEGAAIKDFMSPDRIVIGVDDEWAKERMQELYSSFLIRKNRIVFMDIKSAELTKYAANAMLATRISFMNDLSRLCDVVGADIKQIREGIASDPGIGEFFLYAGIGFGGSCFPKDLNALRVTGEQCGIELNVVAAAERTNRIQKQYLLDLIQRQFGSSLEGARIAVWGLAFKPETDDVRESPALQLVEALHGAGAHVSVFDPAAMSTAKRELENKKIVVEYAANMMAAANAADALVLATEWRQFRQPDFTSLAETMKQRIIFDGRNQYSPRKLSQLGFIYYGIGRGVNP